jgi:two-component system chemotaxis response regulator CheY
MSEYASIQFLVVDDMATMRKVIGKELRNLGATQVVEAIDGSNAKTLLEEAATKNQPFQFIISDWNMPNLSGLELLRFCRSHPVYKNIAFLLVTAEAEVTQVSEAITSGVDSYVVKPFTPAALAEKVGGVFKKRFAK